MPTDREIDQLRQRLARFEGECLEEGCHNAEQLRGRCKPHYDQWRDTAAFYRADETPNPMVCVCDEPLDPSPIGECQSCYRPVVDLMSPRALQWARERREREWTEATREDVSL